MTTLHSGREHSLLIDLQLSMQTKISRKILQNSCSSLASFYVLILALEFDVFHIHIIESVLFSDD